jgi:hypothetical protein
MFTFQQVYNIFQKNLKKKKKFFLIFFFVFIVIVILIFIYIFRLLNVIHTSLRELKMAVSGLTVMSASLEAMLGSFLINQVPQLWADVAYPSLKPLASWIEDLINRVAFLRSWITNGQPASFLLPGFFFPQGFLTGVLQMHSRLTQIPIDTLEFCAHVVDSKNVFLLCFYFYLFKMCTGIKMGN